MMRSLLGFAAGTAALVGVAYFTFPPPAGNGGGGAPPPDPQVVAIVNAIDANLTALGTSMTANMQCIDSAGRLTTSNGSVAAKGADKFRLNFGSANRTYIHDAVEYNFYGPELPGACRGVRWDDPHGGSIGAATNNVGLVDLRSVLFLAQACEANLALAAATEIVNGIVCKKISKADLAIWVDAAVPKRVIRVVIDHQYGSGVLANYSGWAARNAAGAELPSTWYSANVSGTVINCELTYTISNIVLNAPCSDAWFATWGLPYLP